MSLATQAVGDSIAPTATTSLTQSIEKLDGSMASGKSNYQAWKFRIIRILKEKSLLSAIENHPDKSNSKEIAQDNAAFTILTLNIKDSQITHIQECGTAKDAWDTLRVVHQGIGASGRMVLLQRLWALRMVEGEDMSEHLNRFRELSNQVESLSPSGKGMEDNELVTLLSLSLPESYEPIIMALQSRAVEVSLDVFTSKLLQESARRQVVNTTQQGGVSTTGVTAFAARFTPHYGRRPGSINGRGRGGKRMPSVVALSPGRQDGPNTSGRGAGGPKPRGKCLYCQREGHWKRDCLKRKADVNKESSQHQPRDQPGLAFRVMDLGSEEACRTAWIIDSGASHHLGSKKEAFIEGTYQPIAYRGIEIADGSHIEAIGKGDIQIGELHLTGVLHVPQVGGNLVSVGRLIDCGYQVSFEAKHCMISQDSISLRGKRAGNLYYLDHPTSYEQAKLGLATNKSKPQTIEVWHRRLGHRTLDQPTIVYLQAHVSELSVDPSTAGKNEGKLCGTCALGRQQKEPNTGTRAKAAELLEVVHSDICGPMQVSTITGERYFITFIDERSGRIAVTLLKMKSEALAAFQSYKVRAEKEAGREIRTFRSDGGGEYTSQQFKSYLRACGIAHSISSPYSPSHNGLAERGNRTLMESARCMIEEAQLD